jgi:DNA-binding response OmpR family regulator
VLIVDPYRDLRETLGDIVIRWGYVPLLAANGHEALSLARARSPWAVVSEILLQDIDPKDLLGELRRYSEIDRPVFIALTSWCRLEDRLRAGRAGFDRFLLKPADLDQLRQLLVDLAPPRLPAPGVAGPVEPRLEAPTPSFDGSPA